MKPVGEYFGSDLVPNSQQRGAIQQCDIDEDGIHNTTHSNYDDHLSYIDSNLATMDPTVLHNIFVILNQLINLENPG